jgi:Glycosyltransferase family 87
MIDTAANVSNLPRFSARARQSGALVERLLWGLALLVAVIFVVIKVRAWGSVLDAPEQSDFVAGYYHAALIVMRSPVDLYHEERWPQLLGEGSGGLFTYMPTFAWLLGPFARLPIESARRVWFWTSVLALGLTVVLLIAMGPSRPQGMAAAALYVLMPATLDTLFLGQVNFYLGLTITLSVLSLRATRIWPQLLGGVLLGFAGAVKFFPLALAGMTVWKRRWPYGLGALLGVALYVGLGWLALPASVWADYANRLGGMTATLAPPGQSPVSNQSLLAFWTKLAMQGPVPLFLQGSDLGILQAHALVPPELSKVLGYVSVLCVLCLSAWVVWRLRTSVRPQPTLMPPVFVASAIVLLAALLVSPITWWHYTAITAPIFPVVVATRPELAWPWRILMPIGYLLMVAQRGMMLWLPLVPIIATSSLMLFGLLLWWLVLLRYARHQTTSRADLKPC